MSRDLISSVQYRDITQETPPPLTERDKTILKELLEGCLGRVDHKNIVQVMRDQLRLPNNFTAEQKARIETISETVDWSLWCSQFKFWLGSGRWFRTMKGIIL